ncbi:DUF3168 domain-containing protein [Aestuariibius sp. HNIBRBA575]|uniref:DUF3168 domain-containing protein n=1 Tax=Aestuariibius sp. HNIBRBA575 TaxID=3233343 RepID=UPI0034A589CE
MSYGVSAALQAAVYQALSTDGTLTGLVGTAIYDALPTGSLPSIYVTLGQETVSDRSDKVGHGAAHEFVVSVVTDVSGFAQAKEAAAAISDALVDANLTLSRGMLCGLQFLKAKAARVGSGGTRRIDLTFLARVDDI